MTNLKQDTTHQSRVRPPGGGGTQIIFWWGCASQNPEMGVLRADYKHKI